ncbi:hypothetical protein M8J76_011884 [Diaphorina citri]|nr:hypothetical protein M8J76_011884 [Diaphorina citri]
MPKTPTQLSYLVGIPVVSQDLLAASSLILVVEHLHHGRSLMSRDRSGNWYSGCNRDRRGNWDGTDCRCGRDGRARSLAPNRETKTTERFRRRSATGICGLRSVRVD